MSLSHPWSRLSARVTIQAHLRHTTWTDQSHEWTSIYSLNLLTVNYMQECKYVVSLWPNVTNFQENSRWRDLVLLPNSLSVVDTDLIRGTCTLYIVTGNWLHLCVFCVLNRKERVCGVKYHDTWDCFPLPSQICIHHQLCVSQCMSRKLWQNKINKYVFRRPEILK